MDSNNDSLKMIVGLIVVIVLISTALMYSITTEQHNVTARGISVLDASGRILYLEKRPSRVASLSPSITEIMFALGLEEYLVAVDNSSNYPQTIVEWKREGRVVDVGGYWWSIISIEKLAAAMPDVVLADLGAHEKLAPKLEELNITVVFLHGGSSRSIEDILSDIWIVASIFGVEDRASLVINNITSTINLIKSRIPENTTPPKVFLEVGEWGGIWTTGSGTFLDEMLRAAGGLNVFSKYNGWVSIGNEDVVLANPDVIICLRSEICPEDYRTIIENRPEWSSLSAVKNGNVWFISNGTLDLLCRPGPRIGEAISVLAKILYPDLLGPLNNSDVLRVTINE